MEPAQIEHRGETPGEETEKVGTLILCLNKNKVCIHCTHGLLIHSSHTKMASNIKSLRSAII